MTSENKEPKPVTQDAKPDKPKKKSTVLRRIAKWSLGIILTLVVIVVLFASVVVWILTPERLTPLVAKYGSEYLIADVELDRAELTFWSTFPELRVDVDRLRVISHGLDALTPAQRAELPVYADSLLSVEKFSGGINILKLMVGKIAIYDVDIHRPEINLVAFNEQFANYDIVPPSEEVDTTATEIPEISIRKFAVTGGSPVRYFSLADSIDVGLMFNEMALQPEQDNPAYSVTVTGDMDASIQPYLVLTTLPIVANGNITWNYEEPSTLRFDDFTLGAGPLKMNFDTRLNMDDDLVFETFKGSIPQTRLMDVVNALPMEYRTYFKGVKTDLSFKGACEFTKPYRPAVDSLPSADMTFEVPDCYVTYEEFTLHKFAARASVNLDGDNLDRSTVKLDRFTAILDGVGFGITGEAGNLMSDPWVNGTFKGGVSFAKLPKKLLAQIPATIRGELRGDIDFALRQSYLTINEFHRIKLDGEATLTGLRVTQQSLGVDVYSDRIQMRLGSNESFIRNDYRSDSLLTASLRIDSLYADLPGMNLTTRNMLLGLGVKNDSHTMSRSSITPIGAVFKMDRLRFSSVEDSMKVALRDITARASMTRYEDYAKVPLIRFDLDAGNLRFIDPLTRVNFHESTVSASFHPRLKPVMSAKMEARYDSIARLYPNLRPDSIYALAKASRRSGAAPSRPAVSTSTERMDYGLDSETKNLLRWIDFQGRLTAKRARLFTPYFPVRNRLSDIDLSINSDSITVRNTLYRMGHSDFLINGSISNLTGALTSRRQTLEINLDVVSDTIDVNEIAEAAFRGAAFADRINSGESFSLGDTDNDELMQSVIDNTAASDSMAPILIPTNIEANVRFTAAKIIYSDLVFDDFQGVAMLYDGALNLSDLSASTEMGSIILTALYNGRTKNDLSFAFGMKVNDFNIAKFIQLVPAVDTLMPLLQSVSGIINADMVLTTDVDSQMNLVIPSLYSVLSITGDSLVLLDDDTFRKIGKWLLFKHKDHNMVDHMEVEMVVENSQLEIFPFIFQIDRYKLGVMGSNDLALNLNYHISVLKSPIPFRFGINIKGNADKMKIRLGRAKFKEDAQATRIALVDTTRINLVNQIQNVFRRGVSRGRVKAQKVSNSTSTLTFDEAADTISSADSLFFINEGLLPKPPEPAVDSTTVVTKGKKKKK